MDAAECRAGLQIVRNCEGFRMPAHDDSAACAWAGVRKPPGKMLWGERRGLTSSADVNRAMPSLGAHVNRSMERRHAKAEAVQVKRHEPIPHHAGYASRHHCGSRNEPVALARSGDGAWCRAPAVEEARGRREHVAGAAVSLAR